MISSLRYGWVFAYYFLPTGAIFIVVVDNSACLQMLVYGDRYNIFEATPSQVVAYLVGKTIANRD